MKKLLLIGIPIILVIVVIGAKFYSDAESKTGGWLTDIVSRGNIKTSISASGSLAALTTVEVGSQISGNILKLYANFNDKVKAGQLLAQLDPSTYQAQVQQATANLENAKASMKNNVAQIKNLQASKLNSDAEYKVQKANLSKAKVALADAERNMKRIKALFKRKLVSNSELDSAQTALDSSYAALEGSKAQLAASKARQLSILAQIEAAIASKEGSEAKIKQMEAQLKIANINLSRTKIFSPIDGVVISREVDEGQTVAASLQAPKLFIIAQDMKKMQIETAVDEADIGMVKEGQRVSFTVDAFKNKKFHGKVQQVRLFPEENSNVVTYAVMVNVKNPELLLKPGMTANVEILVGNRKDVLRIPNKAMYFKVPDFLKKNDEDLNLATDTVPVWILNGNGIPERKDIKIGISNDKYIEFISGDINENDEVVIGRNGTHGKFSRQKRKSSVNVRKLRRTARRI